MTTQCKKAAVSLVLFGILFLTSALHAQEIYSNAHVEVIRLQDRVFLLRQQHDFTVNCVVLAGESGLLLMDTGFGEKGEFLLDALGVLGKEVKVIVNSHGHPDHMGGNQLFGKDVLVIGHQNCAEALGRFGQRVQTVGQNPTHDFEGSLVFLLGYTGGHSECDIMTYVPDLHLAYLGDLYFSESFPLVLTESGSSVETLLEHYNEIFQSLPDNTLLIPGHGKTTGMEYFGGYIALLEETVDLVRKKMKAGWSLQKIQDGDVLKKYGKLGQYLPFITKESWIEQIYLSYSQ